MTSFLGHNPLHTFLTQSTLPLSKPKPFKNLTTYASISIPPRDRVIDFGKYKGRMLGTLPSNYLKWVSNTLRARDFEEWAKLADQVLEDPVYKDRLEWELAEKHLNGDALAANSMSQGSVAELLELSQRFGWDNEDKVGWSKVDFPLLGTSKGGRIPRVKEGRESEVGELKRVDDHGKKWGGDDKGKRGERRERVRMKRGGVSKMNNEGRRNGKSEVGSCDDENVQVYNPFPGRESLLRKVLNRRNTIL